MNMSVWDFSELWEAMRNALNINAANRRLSVITVIVSENRLLAYVWVPLM